MQNLQFHPLAEVEANEASLYYEKISLMLSLKYLEELTSSLNRIEKFPESYPAIYERIRKCALLTFPYSLFYAILKNGVYIIAVAHVRRRPSYWKERIKDIPSW